jgi:hypothetical protein
VVDDPLAPEIYLDHARSANHLRQILVGGEDADLLRLVVLGRHRGGARQRIVRLEIRHRPDGDPELAEGLLQRAELLEDRRVHPCAVLVVGPQLISKALDDVIGCNPDEGCPDLKKRNRPFDHRPHRGLGAGPHPLGQFEVVSKQLIGPVDEVNLHASLWRWAPPSAVLSRAVVTRPWLDTYLPAGTPGVMLIVHSTFSRDCPHWRAPGRHQVGSDPSLA